MKSLEENNITISYDKLLIILEVVHTHGSLGGQFDEIEKEFRKRFREELWK